MSILINMEMPKNCAECPCRMIGYTADLCNVLGKFIDCVVGSEGRRKDCPLIEVPPHGRLIDADAINHEDEIWKKKCIPQQVVYNAWVVAGEMPTVIPADKDGE